MGRWDNLHVKSTSDVIFQYCIIGEAIDPQRFGALLERPENITIHHCLWINNQSRNPKGKAFMQSYNNVVYNWGKSGYVGGHSKTHYHVDMIGNYFIAGPNSSNKYFDLMSQTDHYYHRDNYADLNKNGKLDGVLITDEVFLKKGAELSAQPYYGHTFYEGLESVSEAWKQVIQKAGAYLQRDEVDKRLIRQLRSLGKSGTIIHNEQEVGGQPAGRGGRPFKDSDGDGMPDKWGMYRGTSTRHADNQCCGQIYIDLYKMEPAPHKLRKIRASIDAMVNTPQQKDWWWVDALQMAMPIYAGLGEISGDSRYFEKMYELYNYTKTKHGGNGLYNPKDGLWWRDADFVPPYKEPNGKNCYWSRGNGWVYAALLRVMESIPANEPHRAEYLEDFLAISKAAKACQRKDGFWNVSLHDPDNYGGKETSGTALFVYGMAWGINKGILDRKEYLPVVLKAWNALVKEAVHENGFLGWVQGTGKEPKDGQPLGYDKVPDFEDFGTGCFLLGASEVYKLR